jgi:hypothetical protein
MPHSKESLQVLRVILSREVTAKALMLTADEATELFHDARLTGRLAGAMALRWAGHDVVRSERFVTM